MKLLVSVNPWFGDGNIHRQNRYKSNDPATITRQLNCMQATTINGMRVEGVLMTWQGPLAPFQHGAALEMCLQCSQRGMLFCLLLDPWCAKLGTGTATTNVTNALANSTSKAMLNSVAYVPERYVLDFNTGANLSILGKSFPNLTFLAQGQGFSWPAIDMTITDSNMRNAACVANLKGQNSNPAMKVPGVFLKGFNDAGMPTPKGVALAQWTGTRDMTMSVWGDQPARVLDDQAGGLFFDQWAVTPQTCPYWQGCTWNDCDERTNIEPDASRDTGIPIY